MTQIKLLAASTLLLAGTLLVGCNEGVIGERSGFDSSTLFFFPENLAEPIRVLRQNDNEVLATVSAGSMMNDTVILDGETYTQVRLPGFSSHAKKGYPEIPSVQVIVAVPEGKTLEYDILETSDPEISNLSHPVAFKDRLAVHNGKKTFVSRNIEAYDMVHGRNFVKIEEQSYAGREKIAIIRFFPVQYDPMRRELKLTAFAKIRFYFSKSLSLIDESAPVSGSGPSLLDGVLLNNEQTSGTSHNYGSKIDLIIAHENFRSALTRLIEFKKQRGRQVREHYVTGKTNAEIKQIIATEYKSGTAPTHTLLVGNIDLIPAFRGSNDNTWTDFNYQALDNGSVPDISLGRIPAHSDQELNAFIDKAIGRETAARNYDEVLLTAGKDTQLGCPVNVQAVGSKFQAGNASIKVTKKFRSEGASTQDVISGYNSNPNIIVYDGHGYQQGMVEIPLLINDLPQLRNTSFPIILDIACLNANWSQGAKARNFAEKILFQQGAGAAGIMASGGSGNGHEYFQSIGQIMGTAKMARTQGETAMNEIGQVILAAKIKHGAEDRTFWNYYGDPASSVWESDVSVPGTSVGDTTGSSIGSSSIQFGLSAGDGSAVLFAATGEKATSLSWCAGSKATCSGSSYVALKKVKTAQGLAFFATANTVTLQDGMAITGKAQFPDGSTVLQEVKVSRIP